MGVTSARGHRKRYFSHFLHTHFNTFCVLFPKAVFSSRSSSGRFTRTVARLRRTVRRYEDGGVVADIRQQWPQDAGSLHQRRRGATAKTKPQWSKGATAETTLRRCGATLGNCCYGSRDVAASQPVLAVSCSKSPLQALRHLSREQCLILLSFSTLKVETVENFLGGQWRAEPAQSVSPTPNACLRRATIHWHLLLFSEFKIFVLVRALSTSHSAPTQSLVPPTAVGT